MHTGFVTGLHADFLHLGPSSHCLLADSALQACRKHPDMAILSCSTVKHLKRIKQVVDTQAPERSLARDHSLHQAQIPPHMLQAALNLLQLRLANWMPLRELGMRNNRHGCIAALRDWLPYLWMLF